MNTALNIPLENAIRERLREVYDPEIPVNVVDLSLIYEITVNEVGEVHIQMTLTNPNCPMAETFPLTVQSKALEVPGVTGVDLELVWDPPWDKERMSDAAKLHLGLL